MRRVSMVTNHLCFGRKDASAISPDRPLAIITGGTSGIGLGVARAFASRGYSLLLLSVDSNGQAVADQLASENPPIVVTWKLTNLASRAQITAALRGVERVDVLVNVAGVQHVAPVEEFSDEKWDLVMDVNLTAPFLLSRAVWPLMKQRRYGRIIHVSSVHGKRASAFKAAYVASKHGLLGLSKVLAVEGADCGITSNAICPGYVMTPLVEKQIEDQARAHQISRDQVISQVMLRKHAIKEFVSVDAIAELCLYLTSEFSGSITGSEYTLDGGWTVQ